MTASEQAQEKLLQAVMHDVAPDGRARHDPQYCDVCRNRAAELDRILQYSELVKAVQDERAIKEAEKQILLAEVAKNVALLEQREELVGALEVILAGEPPYITALPDHLREQAEAAIAKARSEGGK